MPIHSHTWGQSRRLSKVTTVAVNPEWLKLVPFVCRTDARKDPFQLPLRGLQLTTLLTGMSEVRVQPGESCVHLQSSMPSLPS